MGSALINETSELSALGNFTNSYQSILTEIHTLQQKEPLENSIEGRRLQWLMDIRHRFLDVQASVAQSTRQVKSTAGA